MAVKAFTPEDIARQGLARLRAKADPRKARDVQKYFKETVKSYGVSSPDVRAIAADLYLSIKKDWAVADAIRLCDIVFPELELEAKAIGALILARFKKELPKSLFSKVKSWLAANRLDNWASVDVFCPDVVGALIVKNPEFEEKIKSWAGHPNRWVKRASVVSFIKLAKKEEHLDTIYGISRSLFSADDDLVQKANGWLLREAGKKDMGRLEKFLLRHGPAIPRTTLRYAIERFDEKRRKELLIETNTNAIKKVTKYERH
jgi:3-methyladenine DNA glycosylase AlkD